MINYVSKVNEIVSCIYGTYHLKEGKNYPDFLYDKFPKFFDVVEVQDPPRDIQQELQFNYEPLTIEEPKIKEYEAKRRTNK